MLVELWSLFSAAVSPLPPSPMAPPPPAVSVSVQVMSESLCIDCQRFFEKSLIPTYRTLGPSVMKLQVIPFGNSRIDYEAQKVTCQHGEAECDANTWQQCAVDQTPPAIYIDFFDCLEKVLPMGHREEPLEESLFRQCAAESTLVNPSSLRGGGDGGGGASLIDFQALKTCHDDPATAWSLQVKYAKKTPPHNFVPWVLIDHQFVDVDQQDFFQQVCQAFVAKGGSHPACASSTNESIMMDTSDGDTIIMDPEVMDSSTSSADHGPLDPSLAEPGMDSSPSRDLDMTAITGITSTIRETRTSQPPNEHPNMLNDAKKQEEDDGSSLLYQDVDGGSSFFFFFSKLGPRIHDRAHSSSSSSLS